MPHSGNPGDPDEEAPPGTVRPPEPPPAPEPGDPEPLREEPGARARVVSLRESYLSSEPIMVVVSGYPTVHLKRPTEYRIDFDSLANALTLRFTGHSVTHHLTGVYSQFNYAGYAIRESRSQFSQLVTD